MIDTELLKAEVIARLKEIHDPEIPLNIYELGLIYGIDIEETPEGVLCRITMTLTAPGCPVSEVLVGQVQSIAALVEGIDAVVLDLVFDPPWSEARISYEGKLALGLL